MARAALALLSQGTGQIVNCLHDVIYLGVLQLGQRAQCENKRFYIRAGRSLEGLFEVHLDRHGPSPVQSNPPFISDARKAWPVVDAVES